MKLLSEGAEAKIYLAKIFGKQVVVKKRHAKPYRAVELDTILRKMRTKKESHIISMAMKAGVNVPIVYAAGKDAIYMQFLNGKLLRDTGIDEATAIKAGLELAKLHGAGIAHGDFTPANLMLLSGEVFVIDFGLAEPNAGIEEKAIDLLLMKRSLPRNIYATFEKAYASSYASSADILKRLAEIEKRGRYQVRTVANF